MKAQAVDVRTQIQTISRNENFNKINKGYVNFTKGSTAKKRRETTVWQQMPVNFFFNLLHHSELYFKQFSAYDERDERQLSFYKESYPETDKYKQKMIQDFSRTAYISCWYQSENLTDIVFKEYAKGSVGVAIGTKVDTLLNTLTGKEETKTGIKNELFYGDTVYLSDQTCKDLILPNPADLISPLFIKSENHNDDREFRLAYIMNTAYSDEERFLGITQKDMEMSARLDVEPLELIQTIAVRKDDKCTLELTEYLLKDSIKEKTIQIKKDNDMDGFTVIHLERI